MKYIIVGYNKTWTNPTGLLFLGSTNLLIEAFDIYSENFDPCEGRVEIFDVTSGERILPADDKPNCNNDFLGI